MILPAFLARVKPVSTIANPHCMKKTRIAPIRYHTDKSIFSVSPLNKKACGPASLRPTRLCVVCLILLLQQKKQALPERFRKRLCLPWSIPPSETTVKRSGKSSSEPINLSRWQAVLFWRIHNFFTDGSIFSAPRHKFFTMNERKKEDACRNEMSLNFWNDKMNF